MRYFILFVALLFAGCTSPGGPATETSSDVPADGPLDMSGTITTASYEQCLEKCSSGPGSGPYCEDGCRFEQAENTIDTSYCDQLYQKDGIPECYGTVAIAAGDIKICERLTNTEDYNHCVAAFSPR